MFHCIIVAVERRHDHHHDDHDHVCLSLHASFSDVLIPKMRLLATAKIFQRRRRMEGLWEVPTSLKLIASESDMNRRCSVRMCKLAATRNARNKFRDQYCTAFVYFKWHSHKFAPNYRTNYHSANQLSHPLWPELAQLHYFGKILTVYLQFLRVNLVFGKIKTLLWQFLCYWANFHCCKWTNIEKFMCHSGHSANIQMLQKFMTKNRSSRNGKNFWWKIQNDCSTTIISNEPLKQY